MNTWFQEIHTTLLKVTQLVREWRVDTTIQLPHSYRIAFYEYEFKKLLKLLKIWNSKWTASYRTSVGNFEGWLLIIPNSFGRSFTLPFGTQETDMKHNTMDTMWVKTAIFWQDGPCTFLRSRGKQSTAGRAGIPSQHQQKPLCVKGVSPDTWRREGQTRWWSLWKEVETVWRLLFFRRRENSLRRHMGVGRGQREERGGGGQGRPPLPLPEQLPERG